MRKGSLTAEASLVLPIFLAAVLSFISLFPVAKNQEEIGFSVMEAGKWASEAAYFYEKTEQLPRLAEGWILQEMIRAGLSEDGFSENSVRGGRAGLFGLESEVSEEIFLRVFHSPKAAASLVPMPFSVSGAQAGTRGFLGDAGFPGDTGDPGAEREDDEDVLVYVTEYGIVYHRSLTCPHLNLHILAGTAEEIDRARNDKGARFYPCEYCRPGNSGGTFYYTTDGDRYHRDYHCKALTRRIRQVPLREAGLPPCHLCGDP